MENIKETIAKNLVELRKKNKYTQGALAEKLNYSDKAISRWERAETLPDIEVLCRICDLYGVTFEYLLQKEQPSDGKNPYIKDKNKGSKISIALIAICTVWIIATVSFSYLQIAGQTRWTLFVWAIPCSCAVGLVCNHMWGTRFLRQILLSIGVWSLILSLYLELLNYYNYNVWMMFIVGVPIQMIIILTYNLKKSTKRED